MGEIAGDSDYNETSWGPPDVGLVISLGSRTTCLIRCRFQV
jgi:hypothetical protein